MTDQNEEGIQGMLNQLVSLIIIVLIFAAILTFLALRVYKDDSFEKNHIAKDMALALEAIQTGQGNTILSYTKYTDSYSFAFKQGIVQNYKTQEKKLPLDFMAVSSTFSIDQNIKFTEKEMNHTGTDIHPNLIKTGNNLYAETPDKEYNLNLHYYEDINTSTQPKTYTFSTDSKDEQFKEYVKTLTNQPGYQFSYKEHTDTDFVITESKENIIYAPQTKEKRKLASIIANKLIEKGENAAILPSGNERFTIKIKKELASQLTSILQESFKQYYETQ